MGKLTATGTFNGVLKEIEIISFENPQELIDHFRNEGDFKSHLFFTLSDIETRNNYFVYFKETEECYFVEKGKAVTIIKNLNSEMFTYYKQIFENKGEKTFYEAIKNDFNFLLKQTSN